MCKIVFLLMCLSKFCFKWRLASLACEWFNVVNLYVSVKWIFVKCLKIAIITSHLTLKVFRSLLIANLVMVLKAIVCNISHTFKALLNLVEFYMVIQVSSGHCCKVTTETEKWWFILDIYFFEKSFINCICSFIKKI